MSRRINLTPLDNCRLAKLESISPYSVPCANTNLQICYTGLVYAIDNAKGGNCFSTSLPYNNECEVMSSKLHPENVYNKAFPN